MPSDCVFCNIVSGALPTAKIYEDDDSIAFLDRSPVRDGHVLVIPKRHTADFLDMESDEYARVMVTAQKLARTVHEVVAPVRVGLLIKGFDVPHVHVHLIPMEDQWDLISSRHGKNLPPQATPEYFTEFTEKFKSALHG